MDPGLAGLLGRQAPRSKQPFVVTFFRASPGLGPARAPRAARPMKRRPPKRTNELPPPNRLPGIFGEPGDGVGTEPLWPQHGEAHGHPTAFPDTLCPAPCGAAAPQSPGL